MIFSIVKRNLFKEMSLMILGYLSGTGCPEGMSGDGQKKGSGCYFGSQKHFPLDTVLGNFLNTFIIYIICLPHYVNAY